jgi:spermidine synthase
MAAYGSSATPITFFEIDPDVESIARRFFTFLDRCAEHCNVIIGDGRLELERLPAGAFDLLMMDAFSSDAIPAHLVSREALELYLSKLAPEGILLFNSTNRFLDVAKLVSQLVTDGGLVAFERRDSTGDLLVDGKLPSIFVVAARDIRDLGSLPERPGWKRLTRSASFRVWTDDYSSLLPILRLQ